MNSTNDKDNSQLQSISAQRMAKKIMIIQQTVIQQGTPSMPFAANTSWTTHANQMHIYL